MKGWWVGIAAAPEAGGVLVVAETANKARYIGAPLLDVDYIDVTALRVPGLDGHAPGEVPWDEAVRMGAAVRCPKCGAEWAVTCGDLRSGRRRCGECGLELPNRGEEGRT